MVERASVSVPEELLEDLRLRLERTRWPAAPGGDPLDAFELVIPSLPGHGFSQAADEVVRLPRSAVERKYDLVQWSEMPRGGHFAALEEPGLLVDDIRRFFRRFR
jgi:pimeloyl-ACP methyl ester carboxylesterase